MKEILVLKIEKNITKDEADFIKTLSKKELNEKMEEHKQSFIEMLTDYDIEENEIKTLEIHLED